MTTQFYQKYPNSDEGGLQVVYNPLILTTDQRDAMSLGANDFILIFNTTTNKLNFWDGSAWAVVTSV